jgi:NADPH-dependent curcumin reductase CurA
MSAQTHSQTNQRIILTSRPEGAPTATDFRLVEAPVPEISPGEVLLRTIYLSLDPYMRGRMSAAKSYAPPVELGEVMEGGTVSIVQKSRNHDFRVGDYVLSHSGWQGYAVSDGTGLRRLDPSHYPLSTALGVLGMPGFAAYAGLLHIGKPEPGETVVVAAASGPVGSAVGQIARLKGARAVGIAGGAAKCAYVKDELGFDAVIDHHAPDFAQQLKYACPGGIDVYFENVGGKVWDGVFPLLNRFARIPVCGLIAQYNGLEEVAADHDRLPGTMSAILRKSLTVRGFLQRDFLAHYPTFLKEMGEWVAKGEVRYREDFVDGLENAPAALIGMLEGRNFGKLVVRVSDEAF